MKRALVSLMVAGPILLIVGGCGPSGEELRQEEIREQARVGAERAVEDKRRDEMEREKTAAAVAAYHEWFMHAMREPSPRPRKYENAVEHVSLQDRTLVIGLSIDDKEAAIGLCDLTLEEWSDRVRHGVSKILVVSAGDGSKLAESFGTSAGTQVCR
ncbi:MAG: hypothetical protein P8127_04625 [Acidobacteriota bacterium]